MSSSQASGSGSGADTNPKDQAASSSSKGKTVSFAEYDALAEYPSKGKEPMYRTNLTSTKKNEYNEYEGSVAAQETERKRKEAEENRRFLDKIFDKRRKEEYNANEKPQPEQGRQVYASRGSDFERVNNQAEQEEMGIYDEEMDDY